MASTRDAIVADLKAHRKSGAPSDMRRAFARNPERFREFAARCDDLLLDYSKCAVNARTMALLARLARAKSLRLGFGIASRPRQGPSPAND